MSRRRLHPDKITEADGKKKEGDDEAKGFSGDAIDKFFGQIGAEE